MFGKKPTSSTHPPLPPTTEDDRIERLRLLRSRRVGPVTYRRLMAEHGTAAAALAALPDIAAAAGVKDYRPCPEGVAVAELKAGQAIGAQLIFCESPEYPPLLLEQGDAPAALWALGETGLLQKPIVALVGARNASSLGTRMARKLAADLGEAGFTTISGLARGIDAVVHDATLGTGTIAVQAGGVDVLYPAENAELANKIPLRLSEQPIGFQPQARHFPARNRIISGLAQAVIVIEAAPKSGSLITARTALDQGREVMAVPGHPFDVRAAGCNMLLRDGATLVRSADDVLELLGDPRQPQAVIPLSDPTPRRTLHQTAALHSMILDRLGPSPVAEDILLRDLDMPSADVAPALLDLELDGKVQRQPGGMLARVN